MTGCTRVLTYPPKGAIIVTVTRPLFGGDGPPERRGFARDAEPPTHFTSMMPGVFETEYAALEFIGHVQPVHGGEMAVERA